MGFIYSSLNKCDSESWSQFDNRITRMLPFVTGMAYFDLRNYDVGQVNLVHMQSGTENWKACSAMSFQMADIL